MYSKTKFFLGANSNIDFISYFKQLQGQNSSMRLLILKGGPGSGKSSLMKRILSYAEKKGHELEIIPCASDPESLDAVIDYTADFAIMDGTAPHTEDPSLPGARHHIIYTGDLWDTAKLSENSRSIELLSADISDCHKGAGAYIKASAELLGENMRYCGKFINKEKCAAFAADMIKKVHSKKNGMEKKRLLSAVSVGEIKVFSETPFYLADKVFVLEDNWGAAADYILKAICFAARLDGEAFISCPCSVMPEKLDHLIFPESCIAIVTQNCFMKFDGGERIAAEEFYNPIPLQEEARMRLKAAKKLLPNACDMIKQAKNLHDKLEAYYVDAMDFSGMTALFDNIISRFYR